MSNINVEDVGLADIAALQQAYARGGVQSDGLRKGVNSDASNPVTAPWITMPDGGFPFNTPGVINTPVMPSAWTDVINVTVPNGFDGVIKNIANSYNGQGFVQGSGSLLWRILRNGQAVRGYDNIQVFLGQDSVTGSTQIRVGSGDVLQFQVQNVSLAAGGTQIFCYFGGWFYPKKIT